MLKLSKQVLETVIVSAAALFMLFLVIWGVLKYDKEQDVGFLPNKAGQDLQWHPSVQYPIPVYYDHTLQDIHKDALDKAVAQWENVLGKDVFRVSPIEVLPAFIVRDVNGGVYRTIIVTRGQVTTHDAIAEARLTLDHFDMHLLFSVVVIGSIFEQDKLLKSMVHELGHAGFALAHDGTKRSIMHPSRGDGITEADKQRILKMLAEREGKDEAR